MLQINTVFNFFNQSHYIYLEKVSKNSLYCLNSGQNTIHISSPSFRGWDSLNKSYTSTLRLCNSLFNINFFFNFFFIQWARLAFRGKSFRVRNFSDINKFTLNFGYSHWLKLKFDYRWTFFKKRRQRYVIYTFFYKNFCFFKRFFPYIRFYNRYTMRGLRFCKQVIIRRFGKISQHISSLH